MTTTIQKWGNSQGIRIPKFLLDAVQWSDDEQLVLSADKINKGTGRKQQSQVYCCRKDEAGKKLDKLAMYICSKALGHNRIDVVANNYIRGL